MDLKRYRSYFVFDKRLLFWRIVRSFIPIRPSRTQIDVDVVGPFFAVTILLILLYCAPSSKLESAPVSPLYAVLFYILVIPISLFILLKADKSYLNIFQIFGLIGYALYSHIFVILCGLFSFDPTGFNGWVLYAYLILPGLASLKLFTVFLIRTRNPGLRFLVCSIACISNMLFLLFTYLFYVHPSYTHPGFAGRIEQ